METVFRQVVAKFDLYNEARRRKMSTRRSYNYHLGLFGDFIEQKAVSPELIDEDTVIEFLAAEGRRGMSDHTIMGRFISLRAFFRWVERRGLLGKLKTPVTPEMKPKADMKEPRRVTLSVYEQLQASITGTMWSDYRDRFLIAVLYRCGLRINEAASLQLKDIDLSARRFKLEGTKGRKDRPMPFSDEVWRLAGEYLYNRPVVLDEWRGTLWLSNDGAYGVRGPMSKDAIGPMLHRRFKRAGLAYVNPHGFRHGFAMDMMNEGGMDMSSVSALLGHTSVKTTESIYAEWLIDSLQREYNEAQERMKRSRK